MTEYVQVVKCKKPSLNCWLSHSGFLKTYSCNNDSTAVHLVLSRSWNRSIFNMYRLYWLTGTLCWCVMMWSGCRQGGQGRALVKVDIDGHEGGNHVDVCYGWLLGNTEQLQNQKHTMLTPSSPIGLQSGMQHQTMISADMPYFIYNGLFSRLEKQIPPKWHKFYQILKFRGFCGHLVSQITDKFGISEQSCS